MAYHYKFVRVSVRVSVRPGDILNSQQDYQNSLLFPQAIAIMNVPQENTFQILRSLNLPWGTGRDGPS
jgi:hypothetical protein